MKNTSANNVRKSFSNGSKGWDLEMVRPCFECRTCRVGDTIRLTDTVIDKMDIPEHLHKGIVKQVDCRGVILEHSTGEMFAWGFSEVVRKRDLRCEIATMEESML